MYTFFQYGQQALVLDTSQEDVDLAKYVQGGKLNLKIVVNTGVIIGCSDYESGAIFSSATIRPEVSSLEVICNGTIRGCNGPGGYVASHAASPTAGGRGSAAILIDAPVKVDATNGIIISGGGGGGAAETMYELDNALVGGGGFPGGYGYPTNFGGRSSQYGEALYFGVYWNGTRVGQGGSCLGVGLAGTQVEIEEGWDHVWLELGDAGAAGYSINASGNIVTVLGGAANITGAIV